VRCSSSVSWLLYHAPPKASALGCADFKSEASERMLTETDGEKEIAYRSPKSSLPLFFLRMSNGKNASEPSGTITMLVISAGILSITGSINFLYKSFRVSSYFFSGRQLLILFRSSFTALEYSYVSSIGTDTILSAVTTMQYEYKAAGESCCGSIDLSHSTYSSTARFLPHHFFASVALTGFGFLK